MTLQMLNGTIDPNWVMVLLMSALIFFLVRILNRLEGKVDKHDAKFGDVDVKMENHEVRITAIEKKEE